MSSLPPIFGAEPIGLVISSVIYGITILQTYTYYRRYPSDPTLTKSKVAVLWTLDTLHLILCIITVYWYVVTNYGNLDAVRKPYWANNLQLIVNSLVALIVQCFFARRLWKLNRRSWYLPVIIVVLALLFFALGIYSAILLFTISSSDKLKGVTWPSNVGLGAAALADILIAAGMVYQFHSNRTGFPKTDNILSLLIMYSVNTGLMTSICAIISLIGFAVPGLTFIGVCFSWILGKVYVNSMLATLNSRKYILQKSSQYSSATHDRGDPAILQLSAVNHKRTYTDNHVMTRTEPVEIRVQTTREVATDGKDTSSQVSDTFKEGPFGPSEYP